MADTTTHTAYPAIGTKAPAFNAPASTGEKIRLSDYKGKIVVLYFYPRDNTSGCTTEACGFRDIYNKLTRAGVVVLGVSCDSLASHEKFINQHELPFALISDEDHAVCQKYGVWQQKKMAGREYMGIVRTTFVIDDKGKIANIFGKVKVNGHDEEVLAWIKANLK